MDDLITKRQAVERMNDLMVIELKMTRPPTWNEVYNAIKELPSAQQWIPCSEKLPEEPGRYIVTDKYGDVRFAMYSTKIPMRWGGANQPTAWMPLPEAYKEVLD